MHQQDSIPVSGRYAVGEADQFALSGHATFDTSAPVSIAFLFQDAAAAQALAIQLAERVQYVPFISIAAPAGGDGIQVDTAHVSPRNLFLLTDWTLEALDRVYDASAFAGVVLITDDVQDAEVPEHVVHLTPGGGLDRQVSAEIMSRLFPRHDEARLLLESRNQRQLQLLEHIGRELSVFYHNINNPLTILSGNIQLLQVLTDTMQVSTDLMKPISDIASITTRFEEDLKAIAELKEKIRAGNLEKGTW